MNLRTANQSRDAGDLSGVLPVFQTPFNANYQIDYGDLEGELNWLLDNGASGLVMGMVSEVLRLGTAERDTLARAVCAMAPPSTPVVISVSAESTFLAVSHARVAEEAGARAVMCTLPVADRVLPAEAIRHFAEVISAISLPVVIQDASGYVGQELSIELMARLEHDFGERVFFKPEAPPLGQRISELLEATDHRARIYEGSGGIGLADGFRRGIIGTMPGADLVWAIAALWSALDQDDNATVRALRGPLTSLIAIQSQLDAFVAIEKHLLTVQGVIRSARVRGPLGYIPDHATLDDAERLLGELSEAVAQTQPPLSDAVLRSQHLKANRPPMAID